MCCFLRWLLCDIQGLVAGTLPHLVAACKCPLVTQSGHSLIKKEAVVWAVAHPSQTGWPKLLELRQVPEVLMSDTSTRASYCEMMGGAVEPLKALSPRPHCVTQSAAPMLEPSISLTRERSTKWIAPAVNSGDEGT